MRKFFISFSNSPVVEKNANEYSVYPKTNTFSAEFDGKEITSAFTSGKGKSAIPNYYLYFRDEKNSIFYFRSNPEEIESAKKGFAIYTVNPDLDAPFSEGETIPFSGVVADSEVAADEGDSPVAPAPSRKARRARAAV